MHSGGRKSQLNGASAPCRVPPRACEWRGAGGPFSALERVLLEQAAADDRLLDLAGALADEQERRFTHEPLDLVLLGVPVPTVDPEGLGGDLGAVLAGDQ